MTTAKARTHPGCRISGRQHSAGIPVSPRTPTVPSSPTPVPSAAKSCCPARPTTCKRLPGRPQHPGQLGVRRHPCPIGRCRCIVHPPPAPPALPDDAPTKPAAAATACPATVTAYPGCHAPRCNAAAYQRRRRRLPRRHRLPRCNAAAAARHAARCSAAAHRRHATDDRHASPTAPPPAAAAACSTP